MRMTIAVKALPPPVRSWIIDIVNPIQAGTGYRGAQRDPKTGRYEAIFYLPKSVTIEIE